LRFKIYSLFLIFCFSAPIALTYFAFQIQKKKVKKEIKRRMIAGMDRDELVLLSFSSIDRLNKLEWEHAKEFKYQGVMYDVESRESCGDIINYWCWKDDEETKLNKDLDHLVHYALQTDDERKDTQNRLFDFFKVFYIDTTTIIELQRILIADDEFFFADNARLSPAHSPLEPPPNTI